MVNTIRASFAAFTRLPVGRLGQPFWLVKPETIVPEAVFNGLSVSAIEKAAKAASVE